MEQNDQVPQGQFSVGQTTAPPVKQGNDIQPGQNKGAKKPAIAAAVVIVLAVAAWFAYTAYASPARVWEKFVNQAVLPEVVSEDFSFVYEDKGKAEAELDLQENAILEMFSNLKVSISGSGYTNNRDPSRPEGALDLTYTFSRGNTSYSSGAKVVFKDESMYLNLGDNPAISAMLALLSPEQKIEWIKLDFKQIQELAKTAATSTPAISLDYNQTIKDFQNIIQKRLPKLLTVDKFIGKQTLRSVPAMHYSNKLDKNELKALLMEMLDYNLNQIWPKLGMPPEDSARAKRVVGEIADSLIDRMQIIRLETWIGVRDHKLYKVRLASNAPSLISLISQFSDEAFLNEQDEAMAVSRLLEKTSFDGELTLEEEFYDFGKTRAVDAPDNAFDLIDKLKRESQPVPQPEPLLEGDK